MDMLCNKIRGFSVRKIWMFFTMVFKLRLHLAFNDLIGNCWVFIFFADLGSSHPSSGSTPVLSSCWAKRHSPRGLSPVLATTQPFLIDVLHGRLSLRQRFGLIFRYGAWGCFKTWIWSFFKHLMGWILNSIEIEANMFCEYGWVRWMLDSHTGWSKETACSSRATFAATLGLGNGIFESVTVLWTSSGRRVFGTIVLSKKNGIIGPKKKNHWIRCMHTTHLTTHPTDGIWIDLV